MEKLHSPRRHVFQGRAAFPFLAGLSVAVLLISCSVGRFPVSVSHICTAIYQRFCGIPSTLPENVTSVIFKVRTPRVAVAYLCGMSLSVAGCAYQGIFKNPMVSPDILGATAGAGFGAALGLLLGFPLIGVQGMAFLFGLLAVALTFGITLAISKSGNATLTLVLSGMVIAAILQAGISLIKSTADPYSKLPAITFWLMGSMASITTSDLLLILPPIVIGTMPLLLLRWRINVLTFSDEEAESLGVHVKATRAVVITCATLITSAVVAVSGIIGWVGLIMPHLVRMLVGPNYKTLLPCSMLAGGIYLLIVDDVARSILPMEIPLGILTALIGAPYFLYLLYRGRNSWA